MHPRVLRDFTATTGHEHGPGFVVLLAIATFALAAVSWHHHCG